MNGKWMIIIQRFRICDCFGGNGCLDEWTMLHFDGRGVNGSLWNSIACTSTTARETCRSIEDAVEQLLLRIRKGGAHAVLVIVVFVFGFMDRIEWQRWVKEPSVLSATRMRALFARICSPSPLAAMSSMSSGAYLLCSRVEGFGLNGTQERLEFLAQKPWSSAFVGLTEGLLLYLNPYFLSRLQLNLLQSDDSDA